MSREPQLIAGIDLGTSKTCAVVAELQNGTPKVLGVGLSRSSGVSYGQVRDLDEAKQAVAQSMRDAERMAGVDVRDVVCGVAAENVMVRNSSGMGSISGGEVSAADVSRVIDIARAVSLGQDFELLHAIPQEFRVDQQGVSDPEGMTGLRLEAEVFLVGAHTTTLQNIKKAVTRAGYRVAEFVLEPLAAAAAVLTAEERELGCALVDIGAGSTTVAIFKDRKIRHVATIKFAGMHVTNDLVHGLGVTQADAERIKERFGAAYEPLIDPDEMVDLPSTQGQGNRQASRQLIAHVIYQRLQEIFEKLVRGEFESAGVHESLTAGVVLTGGTAHLPGIVELGREVFAMPVRLGEPGRGISGLVDSVQAPRYTVPVGLVLYTAQGSADSHGSVLGGSFSAERWLGPVKRWFQDFF